MVDAGPGSGKTATAAGRIVALLENGLGPERLWAISFSRVAVAEMRQRLSQLGGGALSLPRVTTLDSLAWQLRADEGGLDGQVREGYDRAIEETLAALRGRDPLLLGRMRPIRHLVVDEAQDLVGARALLVAALIDALDPECGVTLLTDEAQAIYGFSAGALTASFQSDTVARHFLDRDDSAFRLQSLVRVHRTGDRRLLALFAASRRHALKTMSVPQRKLARVRRSVKWHAHARRPGAPDARTLILYRSRAEVLEAARRRGAAGLPYRLRLSGLPIVLQPWIAPLLHDCADTTLPRWRFDGLWRERIGEADAEPAWHGLSQAAPGSGGIDLPRLYAALRGGNPPPELCRFDPGDAHGPVIGTVHASKGREMDRVQLMLPRGKSGIDDPDAEARVLFVGATRARHRLEVGGGLRLDARRLGSGRVYIAHGASSALVEIGRDGDFEWCATEQMQTAMDTLRPGDGLALDVAAEGIQLRRGEVILAVGAASLSADLREIRARLGAGNDYRRWRAQAGNLPCLGLGTRALDPARLPKDAPRAPRRNGLLSIPVAIGLVTVTFTPYEGG